MTEHQDESIWNVRTSDGEIYQVWAPTRAEALQIFKVEAIADEDGALVEAIWKVRS